MLIQPFIIITNCPCKLPGAVVKKLRRHEEMRQTLVAEETISIWSNYARTGVLVDLVKLEASGCILPALFLPGTRDFSKSGQEILCLLTESVVFVCQFLSHSNAIQLHKIQATLCHVWLSSWAWEKTFATLWLGLWLQLASWRHLVTFTYTFSKYKQECLALILGNFPHHSTKLSSLPFPPT